MKQLVARGKRARNPGAPRLPSHPFRLCALGQSGSGKTMWVVRHVILDPQSPFDRIIWCAPADSLQQRIVRDLVKAFKDEKADIRERFVTVEGITSAKSLEKLDKLVEEGDRNDWQQLVVLDDLISEIGKSAFVQKLFTAGRHKNLSVCELVQRVFEPGTRTHRVGTDWYALFNFADKTEASTLFRQIAPRDWKQIAEAYHDATLGRGPGSALVIDLQAARSQDPAHAQLRFRREDLHTVYDELSDIQ